MCVLFIIVELLWCCVVVYFHESCAGVQRYTQRRGGEDTNAPNSTPGSQESSYGDLAIISPTIISENKNLEF